MSSGQGRRHRSAPSRRLRAWARSRSGRWVLVAVGCAAVLLAGLIWKGFLHSPAPDVAPPAVAAPPPGPSGTGARTGPVPGAAAATDQPVLQQLRAAFPDNPLNHLGRAGVHTVVVQATSAQPIPIVGWLVPTGMSNTYGSRRDVGVHFALTQRALGPGYLAAVFIQAGKAGVPVTCTVLVDGKVTNTATTSGAYGRTVCLG